MGAGGKGATPKLHDFLLRWAPGQGKRQTAQEQLMLFRALASRFPKD